jgi:hypothetical protein
MELWLTSSDDHPIACTRFTTDRVEHGDHEAADCTAHPQALAIVLFGSVGADRKGQTKKKISKEENRP